MKQYERPEILVTYTVEELVQEAAVCVVYDGTGGCTGPTALPPKIADGRAACPRSTYSTCRGAKGSHLAALCAHQGKGMIDQCSWRLKPRR